MNTRPGVRQPAEGRSLGLGEGGREVHVEAHHLAGRAHLRAEHGVDHLPVRGPEPAERQHGLLDRDRRVQAHPPAVPGRGQHTAGAQLGDRRAGHHQGRGLGQRHPGGLGHERHGAGGPRVGLEHVEHVRDERVLHVDQAAHARRPRAIASVEVRIRSSSAAETVIGGSAHAESPEWMPASSMCSITPPRYISLAVEQRVDVDLDRVVEEPVDQQRRDLAGPPDRAASASARCTYSASWASE